MIPVESEEINLSLSRDGWEQESIDGDLSPPPKVSDRILLISMIDGSIMDGFTSCRVGLSIHSLQLPFIKFESVLLLYFIYILVFQIMADMHNYNRCLASWMNPPCSTMIKMST